MGVDECVDPSALVTDELGLRLVWPGRHDRRLPAGQGFAYTHISPEKARQWSRWCNFRVDHTGLFPDQDSKCHLLTAQLPLEECWWREISRPAGTRHIVYEELAAELRGIESRLYHLGDLGKRSISGGDNATVE